jgi:manganese transport protein
LITIIPAVLVIAAGLDAYGVLILSQVSLSIQLPFAVVPLIWLTCQRRIMGQFVNARLTTLIATAVAGLIVILNILLLAQVAGLR